MSDQSISVIECLIKERQEEMDHFNPDTTIIADNIPYQEDEDLTKKVETMIHRDLALPVKVIRTMRLKKHTQTD